MKIPIKRKLAALTGLWVLIAIAYSSSFTASWHLDDFPNIVRNERIHLERFDYNSAVNTFFAGSSGKLYRPVPMLSFALNWYYGATSVFGYHMINICIHTINGFLLYLVVLRLLQAPRLLNHYNSSEIYWIAFISSILWALNPVQTQAITYIVQRMASMAALFYLVGLYLYLRYKNAASDSLKIVFIAGSVVSYFLAVLSKENTVLFPITIFLIETIFYNFKKHHYLKRKLWAAYFSLILFTLITGLVFVVVERGNPLLFFERLYLERPFSAFQRLLSEPRILMFYLSQLFFPVPSRLSLCHDITVSTSFFEPWTTLPAILIVLAIISWCIVKYKKQPLISFALLFFFLNHGVESTILPLELVFEHRNYLPSFFLFLPLSLIVIRMNRRSLYSNKYGHYLTVAAVCISVGFLSSWTFSRNMVWQSEKSLWEDEISKNPGLARPYHNLAWGYYQPRGQYEEALTLYRKALTLKSQTLFNSASTLNNMGRIYYLKGNYDQALHFFEKSQNTYPGLKISEYQIIMTLMQQGHWQEALEKIDATLQLNDFNSAYLKLKGIALTKTGYDAQSAVFLYRSLKQNSVAIDTRAHLSVVLSRMGRFDEAASLFSGNKGGRETRNPLMAMSLSEMERLRGNTRKSDKFLNNLIHHQGIEKVREMLLAWRKDNLSININYDYYLMKINLMGKN